MKINDDHMYHGAALTQIAEHPQFTAINAFKVGNDVSRSAFRINDDIGVYLKYAGTPKGPFDEYVFTFNKEHLQEIASIVAAVSHVYTALVCVDGRHICCLSQPDLNALIQKRRKAKGEAEDNYTVLVTLPEGRAFRVYVNAPGKKKKLLGRAQLIPRIDFPGRLFK